MQRFVRQLFAGASVAAALAGFAGIDRALAEDFGTVSGQILFQGEPPARTVINKKGDPNVKDSAVCAAEELLAEDLVVDPATKGVANVFVYLRKIDPAKIHPDLAATPAEKKEVVFDQKGCRFIPHALFVRTDQTVVVKSGDSVAHNTHTYPFRNSPQNFILQANDRVGVKLAHETPEILPMQVKCDIHSWMMANWLILDHPYATITDEQGKFTIEKLPAGKHQLRVWHERIGYINVDKNFQWSKKPEDILTVEVNGPEFIIPPIEVPAEKFAAKK